MTTINPLYSTVTINQESLQILPEDSILQNMLLYIDNEQDSAFDVTETVNDSVGNTDTSLGLPVMQQLHAVAVAERLHEA